MATEHWRTPAQTFLSTIAGSNNDNVNTKQGTVVFINWCQETWSKQYVLIYANILPRSERLPSKPRFECRHPDRPP